MSFNETTHFFSERAAIFIVRLTAFVQIAQLLYTGCEIVDQSLDLSDLCFLTFTIKVIPQRAVEGIKCLKSLITA